MHPNHMLRFAAASVALALLLAACGPSKSADPPIATAEPAAAATQKLEPSPTASATATPTPASGPTATTAATATALALTPATRATDLPLRDRLADVAWSELVTLTEDFSPRESATEEERVAADYLAGKFRDMAYEAELRPFSFELMARDGPLLKLNVPGSSEFQAFPISLSGLGQPSGRILDVGRAFTEDIPEQGLEGRIALIARGTSTFEQKVSNVEKAGAVAAVIYNNEPGNFGGRLFDQAEIPAISISQESGEAIRDLLADGDVEATVSVIMQTHNSRNVLGEKPGSGDGVVVLGGHFDTVADTQGANDNGSGVATLLAVAQEVLERSYPFTLRFIAFGAEEVGLFGSRSYVGSLTEEEVADIIAMVNIDVPGSGESVEVIGTRELADTVLEYGESNGLGVLRGIPLSGASSDHAPFQAAGVPVAFFLADDLSRINSPADDIEFVKPELMGTTAALTLGLLDSLAEAQAAK